VYGVPERAGLSLKQRCTACEILEESTDALAL